MPENEYQAVQAQCVGSVSATTARIMAVWAEVMGPGVTFGVDDSVFSLGGDSIHVLSMVFRFQQIFGIEVSPGVVFEAPTPRLLGDWVDRQLNAPCGAESVESGGEADYAFDLGCV